MAVQLNMSNDAATEPNQPSQDNGTGYCDDSNAKLANQEEAFKLVTTMDNLHSARSRSSANMAYEKHRVDRTLRTLKSQRNLMDKARVDNVFKRRRPVPGKNSDTYKTESRVSFSDQTPTSLGADDTFNTASSNRTQQQGKSKVDDTTTPSLSRPTFGRQRSSSSPGSPEDLSAIRAAPPDRMAYTPPVSRRPVRSRIRSSNQQNRELRVAAGVADDIAIEDLESDDRGGNEKVYDIKWKNVVIPERSNSRLRSNKFPSISAGSGRKASLTQGSRPRTASLSSIKYSPTPQDRPQTASAALLSGRSRRELTRLTHIDAIAAADLELRRKMWFSQLAHQKEIEEVKLKVRIDKFIAKVEDDKKRLVGATSADTVFATEVALGIKR